MDERLQDQGLVKQCGRLFGSIALSKALDVYGT